MKKFILVRKTSLLSLFLIVIFNSFLMVGTAFGIVYTTIKNGNWNANSTWDANGTPPNLLPDGSVVNILHNVDGIANNITIEGVVNVLNGKQLELQNPHTFTIAAIGEVIVQAGSNIQVNGHLVIVPGGVLDLQGDGVLSGIGDVAGNFPNNGVVNPGKTLGCLTFLNSFSNDVTLAIELGGTAVCAEHDKLTVNGIALLSQRLVVTLSGGFLPSIGQAFTIVSSGSPVGGEFTDVELPVVPGISWAITYNNPSGTVILKTQAEILPVELISFDASAGQARVYLAWSTATETNNLGFSVEHSFDGSGWKEIGFVDGHGTATKPFEYTYEDKNPANGGNYYRLRQMDFDGAETISPIKFVEVAQAGPVVSIFPNPAVSEVTVQLGDPELPFEARIFNPLGAVVFQQKYDRGNEAIDLQNLPAGIYQVQVFIGGKMVTLPLVRQ